MDETKLHYADSHEWVQVGDAVCPIGITRFAVEQLTDITYVELPTVGKKLEKGKSFGVIESVKSANDLYAPISGEVVEVNKKVADNPAILSSDPYVHGWMIKIRPTGSPDLTGLKNKSDYDRQTASEAH